MRKCTIVDALAVIAVDYKNDACDIHRSKKTRPSTPGNCHVKAKHDNRNNDNRNLVCFGSNGAIMHESCPDLQRPACQKQLKSERSVTPKPKPQHRPSLTRRTQQRSESESEAKFNNEPTQTVKNTAMSQHGTKRHNAREVSEQQPTSQ